MGYKSCLQAPPLPDRHFVKSSFEITVDEVVPRQLGNVGSACKGIRLGHIIEPPIVNTQSN